MDSDKKLIEILHKYGKCMGSIRSPQERNFAALMCSRCAVSDVCAVTALRIGFGVDGDQCGLNVISRVRESELRMIATDKVMLSGYVTTAALKFPVEN
jgi:hypothetical protein